MKKQLQPSELIINPDGSIYHLALRPEHLAPTVITVGDPQRVAKVSAHFDEITFKQQKREFVTHTGRIGDKRLTVIATGIGTDNIDIVLNELDALANIDLKSRQVKETLTSLNIIRIGTSGAIRSDIPVDSFVVSNYGIGLEGLMLFYQGRKNKQEKALQAATSNFLEQQSFQFPISPTYNQAGQALLKHFQGERWTQGITLTATGFYAPQNRILRAPSVVGELFDVLQPFDFEGLHITNLEMETAAIYGMSAMLGHQALSLNAILANRPNGTFSQKPKDLEKELISTALEIICDNIL